MRTRIDSISPQSVHAQNYPKAAVIWTLWGEAALGDNIYIAGQSVYIFIYLCSIDAQTTHPREKLRAHSQFRFSQLRFLKNKNLNRGILRVKLKGLLPPKSWLDLPVRY